MPTVSEGQKVTNIYQAGQTITFAASLGIGSIRRLYNGKQSDAPIAFSGNAFSLGPFDEATIIEVVCSLGSISFGPTTGSVVAPSVAQKQSINRTGIVGRRTQPSLIYRSAATEIGLYSRQRIFGLIDSGIRDIRMYFANFDVSVGGSEAKTAEDFTLDAVLEPTWGGTALVPILFNGSETVVVPRGGFVVSDPIGEYIPKATDYGVRTFIRNAGGLLPGGCAGQASLGEGRTIYTSVPASPLLGAAPTAINGRLYGPASITGYFTDVYVPSTLLTGDSIAEGTGPASGSVQADGFVGLLEKAFGPCGRPYTIQARSGDRNRLRNLSHMRRDAIVHPGGYDRCLSNLGINDVNLNASLAQVQSEMLTFWAARAARGAKVWQTTITPYNTSFNSGVIVDATREGWRTSVNDWLRAGAPIVNGSPVSLGTVGALLAGQLGHPLTGFFDTADTVETFRNSGVYKSLMSSDGLHLTDAGQTAAKAAIRVDEMA